MQRGQYDGRYDLEFDGLADEEGQSIHNFLDSLDLLKYFHLFSGYDSVNALCVLSEADFVRIGVVNARDRRSMLAKLERDFGAPSAEQKATLTRAPSGTSLQLAPPLLPKKKKGLLKGRFPLKATERHKTPSPTEQAQSRSRPSVSSVSSTVSDVLQDRHALLQHQPWFHGRINRKLAEAAVCNDGDILVRESISKPGQYVLTAHWKGKAVHFVATELSPLEAQKYVPRPQSRRRKDSRKDAAEPTCLAEESSVWYRFGGEAYPSMVELVTYHLTSKQPISDASGPVAAYAVPRHVTRSADDRLSLTSSSSVSRRNSLRLEDMDSVMVMDRKGGRQGLGGSVDRLDRASPGVESIGALSLPATSITAANTSPQSKPKVNFGVKIRGKSPLNARRRPPSAVSESGLAGALNPSLKDRLSGSLGSLNKASSTESLVHNPDLPHPDAVKVSVQMVLQHSPSDLARHIARVNLQKSHILLPKELTDDHLAHMPFAKNSVACSPSVMEKCAQQQNDWKQGQASGLANLILGQGEPVARDLLRRFTALSQFAAIMVMGAGDMMTRCTVLRKLVEVAQCLQSDAVADLFGFTAVMRGLRSPRVRRLEATWAEFRSGDSKLALLFDSQLCGIDRQLRHGTSTHRHTQASVPNLEPVLRLLTDPMKILTAEDSSPPGHAFFEDDEDDESGVRSLDAVFSHMKQARELTVQASACTFVASSRVTLAPCDTTMDAFCWCDLPIMLLASRPGMPVPENADVDLMISDMLDAMSEAAEPSQVIGRNTSI
ncbi:breast cancer anti-estrogen resistance protein 3 homolog [Sycon ciliatum]|uniref:breast cancer anti-estrogen resistance protein 3 homolog n=1 Tax=Sycon ciliatum TaxID=27933 RepID=UPI0020A85475|eukprot:scpid39321/ scgid35341/ Breast cancer anti-estrogen resistance protein 3; p130Cas-binding protein AND-34